MRHNRYDNLLMVPGPESDLWNFKDIPHGTVEQVWFASRVSAIRGDVVVRLVIDEWTPQ